MYGLVGVYGSAYLEFCVQSHSHLCIRRLFSATAEDMTVDPHEERYAAQLDSQDRRAEWGQRVYIPLLMSLHHAWYSSRTNSNRPLQRVA